MDARALANLSLAGRIAFGAASLVAPDTAWRGFGVRVPAGNSRYLGRMFGIRDIALAAGVLLAGGAAFLAGDAVELVAGDTSA